MKIRIQNFDLEVEGDSPEELLRLLTGLLGKLVPRREETVAPILNSNQASQINQAVGQGLVVPNQAGEWRQKNEEPVVFTGKMIDDKFANLNTLRQVIKLAEDIGCKDRHVMLKYCRTLKANNACAVLSVIPTDDLEERIFSACDALSIP